MGRAGCWSWGANAPCRGRRVARGGVAARGWAADLQRHRWLPGAEQDSALWGSIPLCASCVRDRDRGLERAEQGLGDAWRQRGAGGSTGLPAEPPAEGFSVPLLWGRGRSLAVLGPRGLRATAPCRGGTMGGTQGTVRGGGWALLLAPFLAELRRGAPCAPPVLGQRPCALPSEVLFLAGSPL